MACDDLSFQVGKQSALEYSRFLLQVAERMVCDTIRYESVSTLIRKRNELLSRVKYQIMEDDMVPVKKHKLALIGFLMGFCFIALSWTGVQKEQDSKTELSKGKTIQTDISKGKQSSTTPVLIEIRTEGQKTTYYIEGEAVVLEKLGDTLVKLKKNDPATVLEIRVSKDTEMWSIYDLNGVLTDINIRRVGYISDDSKKTVVNAPGTGARVKKVSESDDDLRIMLPREEDKDIIATIPKKNVTAFLIRASGKLEHEGLDMDYSMIPDKVKSMLKENPHLIVSILCEKNSKSSDFIRVLGLVKQAGAPRIFIDNTPVNP